MSLPDRLAHALRAATGRDARDATRVAGGDINEAWRVELDDGARAFLKTRDDAPRGEYTAEAGALRWLGEPDGGLGVPEVLGVAEGDAAPDGGGARLLALGWLDEDAPGAPAALGRGLAAVHQAGAAAFGAPTPLRIGPLSCPTSPRDDWPAFYAEQRLARCRPPPTAGRSRRPASPRSSASATGCPSWPARRSRPRACTATCGAATCCGRDGRAVPDRPGGLRRPSRGRPRDAAAVRRARPRLPRRLRGGRAARGRARGARRALAAVPPARPRRAVRRRLRRVRRARGAPVRSRGRR